MTTSNPNSDIETKRVPDNLLEAYFAHFTKNFLMRESTNSIDIEVLGKDSGDQFEAEGARIFGVTFDPKENALEFELDAGDHRVVKPKEIWVAEEPDGFIKAIEVVREDGTREVAKVTRGALAPLGATIESATERPQQNA